MAYDYHWRSGPRRPGSPLGGGRALEQVRVDVDGGRLHREGLGWNRGKLIPGVPHYRLRVAHRDHRRPFATTGAGSSMTYDVARANAALHGRLWDAASRTPYYRPHDRRGATGWVRRTPRASGKWDLVVSRDLGGTGSGRSNYAIGDDLPWEALRARFAGPPAPSPARRRAGERAGRGEPRVRVVGDADGVRRGGDPLVELGDGTTSGEWNPRHVYASPGTYDWTFAASVGGDALREGGARRRLRGVPVAFSAVLPSSAFRAEKNGAEFRTDVRLLNRGSAAVTVTPTFYDQASARSWRPGRSDRRPEPGGVRQRPRLPLREDARPGRVRPDPVRRDGAHRRLLEREQRERLRHRGGLRAVAPGLDATRALRGGTIPQVAVSADASTGYRTNLVVVNPRRRRRR